MKNRRHNLDPMEIKIMLYQLFRGLLYLHSQGICHRDIKPQNLLIKKGRLIISDLGSAKILHPEERNISYICSRCYRAPELIFGAVNYTTKIDLWSAGCIILELLYKNPFFIGKNSVQQLVEIIKVLGTPSISDIKSMNPCYNFEDFDVPEVKKKSWEKVYNP